MLIQVSTKSRPSGRDNVGAASRRPSTAMSNSSQDAIHASAGIVASILAPVRRGSVRNKKSPFSNLAVHSSDRGISSEMAAVPESYRFSESRGIGKAQPLVSSIPFKIVSYSPTSALSPAQQYQQSVGGYPRGNTGEIEASSPGLPDDARAYLQYADTVNDKVSTLLCSAIMRVPGNRRAVATARIPAGDTLGPLSLCQFAISPLSFLLIHSSFLRSVRTG